MASAGPAFPSTKETTNYARLCRLLVDAGSQVLRETFDIFHPPGGLDTVLGSPPALPILQLLRKKKILNLSQWGKLYPAIKSKVTSKNFDITLLMVLFRNICGLTPPAAGWDNLPLVTDLTPQADIARIKFYRNTVYGHASEASVDDVKFTTYWTDIQDTLVRLGGATYEAAIDDLKDECMDPDIEEHYKELLKQWKVDEDSMKEKLDQVVEKLDELKASVERRSTTVTANFLLVNTIENIVQNGVVINVYNLSGFSQMGQTADSARGNLKSVQEMPSFIANFKSSIANVANWGDTKAADKDGNKETGPPVENKDWNLLHSAAEGGDVSIIKTMLSHGFDVNSRDSWGTTPLMVAAAKGEVEAVDFLLLKGADLSLTTNIGRNLLHAAAEGGNITIVEIMFSHNIPIDSSDNDGVTSLMIAASNNNLQIVEFLLGNGADPLLENKRGNNAFFIASDYGSIAVIERLLSCGFNIDLRDGDGYTALMHAAACAKIQAVNYLLGKGADPFLTGAKNGWSLLHFSSQGGSVTIINTFVSYGLDINIKDNSSMKVTPLLLSIVYNNLEAMKYLLERGADPALEDNSRKVNSLHLASIGGNIAIIDAILSSGLDINIQSSEGLTALMFAAFCKKPTLVDFLLHKGADPFLKDKFGRTFLHYASQGGDITIIEKCLSCGLDIESKDNEGKTPLMLAASSGSSDAVTFLLQRSASEKSE